MQPSEPLSPGETYLDEDLNIEVVAVESAGCSYPPRRHEPDAEKRINCVYRKRCRTSMSCVTPASRPDIVYLPKLQYAMFKLTQLVI
jgi:hypothetical protein